MWHTRWKTATSFAQVMGCWGTLICKRQGSTPIFFIGGLHVSAVHCMRCDPMLRTGVLRIRIRPRENWACNHISLKRQLWRIVREP
jgi:hypothetical protein